ncbi:hypothetical protein AB6A40_001626 [Gnathostoma spinigerum]|uniref:Large ribosomal subunit protein mL50 n=1 Tax=Gnathostoma spinigerum TaxID=75299 RepID=A0ABD6EEH8_9BILA
MQRSLLRCVRLRGLLNGFIKSSKAEDSNAVKLPRTLTEEEKKRLKDAISEIRMDEQLSPGSGSESTISLPTEDTLSDEVDMDSIRARGFLKYRYNYKPPPDFEQIIHEIVKKNVDPKVLKDTNDISAIDLKKDVSVKFKLLDEIGTAFKHVIPSPELHRMETIGDVIEFYRKPVSNLTVYAHMARDNKKSLPKNLHIIEHPVRFHPDDVNAYHKGITAYPGSGGKVIGIRNKRLYRQFQPKEHWFDYEDQTFDYVRVDENMPWDPEIAKMMDRYPDKRYNLKTKHFQNVK